MMPMSKQSHRWGGAMAYGTSTTSPSRHHNQPPRLQLPINLSLLARTPPGVHAHALALPTSVDASASGPMDLDADMIPTSPSADSSPSSSDLDTESTGSFFPDRSTTLGTLMGVSAFGGGGQRRALGAAAAAALEERDRAQRAVREEDEEGVGRRGGVWRRRRRMRRRRRGRGSLGESWWRLCRDDDGVGSGAPTSLGEFLDMERQLAGADFLCDGTGGSGRDPVAATALFEADGRVRPPPQQTPAAAAEERGRWRLLRAQERSSSLSRLPVLLTGICSGGAG